MENSKVLNYIGSVLDNMPLEWLNLTTHRLDVYDEKSAKTQFLEWFEALFAADNAKTSALGKLPTAYDYIRLGHPLSCVLEWGIARLYDLSPESVITFSSKTMPVMAILRKNLFEKKNTQIAYAGRLPDCFDFESMKQVYGYQFEVNQVQRMTDISDFDGSTIFISQGSDMGQFDLNGNVDFVVNLYEGLGSIVLANTEKDESYILEIQHVRRRESIAMTPANCFSALQQMTGKAETDRDEVSATASKKAVLASISSITDTRSEALLGSSGLSVQYAIMMGLIDEALEKHPGKAIKFLVPTNCYGGTNDQARRVAACLDSVEILDLKVDGDHEMVQSMEQVLDQVANQDAVPYIIAEIPTNPRVEVPDREELKSVLCKERKTSKGDVAVDPVFILDQTFCPNVQFCSDEGILSSTRTIAYVSGSKFPSGGKVTAGYCVANQRGEGLMANIGKHLRLCDNEATNYQITVLAEQMPSMNRRVQEAYENTREFVNFIKEVLPAAKINFVSEELAEAGFTPSVFSLDLPTKGKTHEEREAYKRKLNLQLINLMITEIPDESKYCVSYGQLKGSYWTIPATSTQGTTKEADKDYIARVALSADMDLERHKQVFLEFVKGI